MINHLKDIIYYQISSIEKTFLALDKYFEDDNQDSINQCIDSLNKTISKLLEKMEKKALERLRKQSHNKLIRSNKHPKHISKLERGTFSKHNIHLLHDNDFIATGASKLNKSIEYSKYYDNFANGVKTSLRLNEVDLNPETFQYLETTTSIFSKDSKEFVDADDFKETYGSENEKSVSEKSYSPEENIFLHDGTTVDEFSNLEDYWLTGQQNGTSYLESAIDLINENSLQLLGNSDVVYNSSVKENLIDKDSLELITSNEDKIIGNSKVMNSFYEIYSKYDYNSLDDGLQEAFEIDSS